MYENCSFPPPAIVSLALALVCFQANAELKITNAPSEGFEWETTEEGVAFAPLDGERFSEPYMAMVRLPAGLISRAHVKSANMYGVVIQGTMSHIPTSADSKAEIALPEGSFYKIPAGAAHISKCLSEVDCVTFLYQDGKFDFVPVSP